MGIKTSVFASKAERENFYKLSRQWGEKWRLYHNLPFLNLFDLENLFETVPFGKKTRLVLSEVEKARLKKTSVDYTLCDTNDTPLLCVEFDGLNDGFNVGPTYYRSNDRGPTSVSFSNPWRKEIIELKLKVALAADFPFFVVGYHPFRDLSPALKVTMVDGIIGVVVASQATRRKFSKGFKPEEVGMSAEHFAGLPSSEQHEIVQDWVIGVEVDADVELNPIYQASGRIQMDVGVPSYRVESLSYPRAPDNLSLQARAKFLENTMLEGARVVLQTNDVGEVSSEAWLPRFRVPHYSGLELCENIAMIFACEKLKALRQKQSN
jgi:hypothetical protein